MLGEGSGRETKGLGGLIKTVWGMRIHSVIWCLETQLKNIDSLKEESVLVLGNESLIYPVPNAGYLSGSQRLPKATDSCLSSWLLY